MTTPDSARIYYQDLIAVAWSEFKQARGRQAIFFLIVTLVTLGLTWRDVQAMKRLEITALTNVIAFAILAVVYLVRAPWIFQQRQAQEVARLLKSISDRDQRIRVLEEKPKRSPAEQHHYDVAKGFLLRFGHPAVIALRHLKTHVKLTFAGFPPISGGMLPPGMREDELLRLYNAALGEGLVTKQEKHGSGERTFEIAQTMHGVLDELLYSPEALG